MLHRNCIYIGYVIDITLYLAQIRALFGGLKVSDLNGDAQHKGRVFFRWLLDLHF
jgi:hypothetical protein